MLQTQVGLPKPRNWEGLTKAYIAKPATQSPGEHTAVPDASSCCAAHLQHLSLEAGLEPVGTFADKLVSCQPQVVQPNDIGQLLDKASAQMGAACESACKLSVNATAPAQTLSQQQNVSQFSQPLSQVQAAILHFQQLSQKPFVTGAAAQTPPSGKHHSKARQPCMLDVASDQPLLEDVITDTQPGQRQQAASDFAHDAMIGAVSQPETYVLRRRFSFAKANEGGCDQMLPSRGLHKFGLIESQGSTERSASQGDTFPSCSCNNPMNCLMLLNKQCPECDHGPPKIALDSALLVSSKTPLGIAQVNQANMLRMSVAGSMHDALRQSIAQVKACTLQLHQQQREQKMMQQDLHRINAQIGALMNMPFLDAMQHMCKGMSGNSV